MEQSPTTRQPWPTPPSTARLKVRKTEKGRGGGNDRSRARAVRRDTTSVNPSSPSSASSTPS
eukprot:8074141-Lingulodinium_polyedra.AAC.1